MKYSRRTIAFIADYDYGTYKFRMPLFREFDKNGYNPFIIVGYGNYTSKLKEGNIKVLNYSIDRKSINPITEIKTFFQIFRLLKKIKPNIVHTFGIKPNIYGTLAAKSLKISKIINTVTGLGSVFVEDSCNNIFRIFIEKLLKLTFNLSNKVIFLNQDDLKYFCEKNIVERAKTFIIKGEGVDTDYFSPENINMSKVERIKKELKISNKIIVTMIARLIWHKGVKEFCNAAEILKKVINNVEFLLIGNIDYGNPFAVDEKFLKDFSKKSIIKWLGFRTDIKEILYISDIVVLPTYYREGIPITLLEAMAMAKPIVATDVPGCREVTKHGFNGFLVKPRDFVDLADKIKILIQNESLRKKFGKNGRERAVKEFSVKKILNDYIQFYQDIIKVYEI